MKRPSRGVIAGVVLLGGSFAGLATLDAASRGQAQLAVRDVAVVDVVTGQISSNQTILIEADRILAIGPVDDTQIPPGAEVIAGEGLFATPGLVDLHVHMEADDLPLFLANGVTTVREMNGSPETLALRAEVQAGKREGPSAYIAGPLLAGVEQQWSHRLVLTPEEGRDEVMLEQEAGYDFVKIYDGLSVETYEAIVATAGELGIPVLGHIPADVGLDRIIRDEQMSIEHVEQIANATVGHMADASAIPDIVRRIATGETAVTPTLAAMEILSSRRSAWFDALFMRPSMPYTPPGVRGWWESLRQPAAVRETLPDGVPGGSNDRIDFYRELTRALWDAGVPMLVGTDTPNPLLVPGFSMHHELEALVRAGLDPARILRAATHEAALHLDAEEEFGALRPNLRADIVLIGGNPFDRISHLSDVRGLVLRGEWFSPARLEDSLAEVQRRRVP